MSLERQVGDERRKRYDRQKPLFREGVPARAIPRAYFTTSRASAAGNAEAISSNETASTTSRRVRTPSESAQSMMNVSRLVAPSSWPPSARVPAL
jgi:hypothetical protein